ncbi:MAG: hypothetical protein Q9217_003473 [Psora testacea]
MLPIASNLRLKAQAQELPNTEDGVCEFAFDPDFPSRRMWQVVARCTLQMIKSGGKISDRDSQIIFNVLQALNSLENITVEFDTTQRIRPLLLSILGETPRPTMPYEYPEPLQQTAAIILARIDEDLAVEQELEQAGSISPEPGPTALNPSKRRRTSRSTTPASTTIDDPTVKNVMRGIIILENGRRTYRLDPNYKPAPRDCNVIGHNGLTVGQWWPLRVCAIRDGAHGAMIAGIAGGASIGAFSIVVSSEYADLDKDYGNTLYYSGSNSQANTDPLNPVITYATKAMRLSHIMRRPIRVLRSGKATSQYAPAKGLRYDGLYSIRREDVEKNTKGGAYLRFQLVRDEGQAEIDLSRPNARERQVFDALRNS